MLYLKVNKTLSDFIVMSRKKSLVLSFSIYFSQQELHCNSEDFVMTKNEELKNTKTKDHTGQCIELKSFPGLVSEKMVSLSHSPNLSFSWG